MPGIELNISKPEVSEKTKDRSLFFKSDKTNDLKKADISDGMQYYHDHLISI